MIIVNKIIATFNYMGRNVPKEKATVSYPCYYNSYIFHRLQWNETFLEPVYLVFEYPLDGYYRATTTWYERIWNWAKEKMKRMNGNIIIASIKHSCYLTALFFLSLFVLEGYKNISILRWYFIPIALVISECVILSVANAWPGCPLFDYLPELRCDRQ